MKNLNKLVLVGLLISTSLIKGGGYFGDTTPLNQAVEDASTCKGKLRIVNMLLKNGADVDKTDKYGFKPLHYASRVDVLNRILEEMKKRGINVEDRINAEVLLDRDSNYVFGPVELVSSALDEDPRMVEVLLKNGLDVNSKDKDGDTPLHRLVRGLHLYSSGKDCRKFIYLASKMLDYGASFDDRNLDGDTPLELLKVINPLSSVIVECMLMQHKQDRTRTQLIRLTEDTLF